MWSTLWALKMERATSQNIGQSAAWEVKEAAFPKNFQKDQGCAKILILAQGDQF